jgi:kynurenine formamidase
VTGPEAQNGPGRIAAPVPGEFEVIDLSQPISPDMAAWRGTERTEMRVEEVPIEHSIPGGRISATHLKMVAHAGTHVDAARHFFPEGQSIDDYPVERFVCRGVAIDLPREGAVEVSAEELAAVDPGVRAGDAVLLHFGYADRYTEDAYYDHPYLAADAAEYLAEKGIGICGVDVITPDKPSHRREVPFGFPVHATLLGADVLIVENLGPGLRSVVGREFLFVMAPFSIVGADASPVVPLALLSDGR